jgi:hypothetical protein
VHISLMRWRLILLAGLCLAMDSCTLPGSREVNCEWRQIGVARVDITPDYPVRLAGYAARKTESEGIVQKLWAKALVIGSDEQKPAILITVDTCGIPTSLRDDLATRLAARGIDPTRVAVCCSHTHSAPLLEGYVPNLFGGPMKLEEQARIHRYTVEFQQALEKVALEALKNRQTSRLSWGQGTAMFAANRRTKGGPVDHDLPALFATGQDGRIRAVLAGYACHCTTLTGESNQICGDWAGFAQESLEQEFPGAVAMITIGCGGDQNPFPRPGLEVARGHGMEIATNVVDVQRTHSQPLNAPLQCGLKRLNLDLEPLPSRQDWEELAGRLAHAGYQARMNLARLDRGESIPNTVPYLIQTWSFGSDLSIVFLAGEVVVDYSTRLKHEFAGAPIWVTAYANGVPCYIPSERILAEGGYEGGGSMVYYDLPARFTPDVENVIVSGVRTLLKADVAVHTPK